MNQHKFDLGAQLPPGVDYPEIPLDGSFSFQCQGCGDCCRKRSDIVLSGYDLYQICCRLALPPQMVMHAFCQSYIGSSTHLPVVRLRPRHDNGNCPFLTAESSCAIHSTNRWSVRSIRLGSRLILMQEPTRPIPPTAAVPFTILHRTPAAAVIRLRCPCGNTLTAFPFWNGKNWTCGGQGTASRCLHGSRHWKKDCGRLKSNTFIEKLNGRSIWIMISGRILRRSTTGISSSWKKPSANWKEINRSERDIIYENRHP